MGYRNEELSPALKAHIWKSVGAPSLLYSMSTGPVSNSELSRLESFQGQVIKSALYLNKRAHHSNLLRALQIDTIESVLNKQRVNLLQRVFKATVSSYSVLCSELISRYATEGIIPHKTLVGHIMELGLSPVHVICSNHKLKLPSYTLENGITDSLKLVLEQHVKPGNEPHSLLYNLTRSF